MPTKHVTAQSSQELQDVADDLGKSRKILVVTGAGISTNCGIPDFRSEDGLYSLIQAQYDAALLNPPWQHQNTFDIDDRPKKKRKQWYYEVVAPDGQVVDVIDEEIPSLNSTTTTATSVDSEQNRPSSGSRSTNTTSSSSRASSPTNLSDVSSLSSCPSFTPEPGSEHLKEEPKAKEVPSSPRRSSRRKLPSGPAEKIVVASTDPEVESSIVVSSPPPVLQQEESSTSSTSTNTQSSQNSRSLPNLKGRDLFDSMVWSDAFTTSVFYMFISSLRKRVLDVKEVTETHKFLSVLRDGGRLVRNYTQNIDMLEQLAGLSGDMSHGPGNRSTKAKKISGAGCDLDQIRGCESVPLHGTLARLRCNICSKLSDWDEGEREAITLSGTAPDCPFCVEANAKRTTNGRRGLAIGRLRPDIVLYGEEHPHATIMGQLLTNDLGLALDVLLIMGTSLKVHGLKVMLREFAKAVHARGGKVIFVNRTKPPESIWGDVIDYWIEIDCDEWVLDLKERRPDIWGLPPKPKTTISKAPERRVSAVERSAAPTSAPSSTPSSTPSSAPRKRPQAIRDDKVNGVFITFRILDTLIKAKDVDGRPGKRSQYWPYLNRYSNASVIEVEPEPVPVKKPPAKKRISKPVSKLATQPVFADIKLPKRPSIPLKLDEDTNNQAYMVSDMWQKLREKAPGLPPLPPELRQPFRELPGNLPSYLTPFDFGAFNHFPNLGGGFKEWPLGKMGMDLINLPPKGLTIPVHTPKNMKTVVSRAINHSYGTRAAARSPTADSIVVDTGPVPSPLGLPPLSQVTASIEVEETIVVDRPLTPNERIKRLSSIGSMLSPEGSQEEWHDAPEVMTGMTE